MESIAQTMTVMKRELKAYFESPVAYVFLVVFLMLVGFFTFSIGNFYEAGQADLRSFFFWHPWVYLILVPAASMRLWAEDRKRGTIELLLTLPITMANAILGKFFAAWLFLILALALTFPIVLTTTYLGDPDMGAIWGGYLGSVLLAGTYLAVGMLTSATTRNQVISFVLSVVICLFLVLAGWPPVTQMFSEWAPDWLVMAVASVSVMPHFESIQRGVLDLADVGYYVSMIVILLFGTYIVIENRKSA
jgi:ABC-2 type transport system permease protein